ncbi:MAG: GDSL-type esterase/lipase family protein, partial [Cryomorphaceae bacterium]
MGLLLLMLLSFASCKDKDESAPMPVNQTSTDTIADPDTTQMPDTVFFKYLALGDSYTIGTALPDSSRNYPNQLVERLNEDSLLDGSEPDIIAFGGWRTDQLISAIEAADLAGEYELVSLLIGVNNQFQNRSDSVYAIEFEELLNTAIDFAGDDTNRVFVLSIPDYGVTPFGQSYPNATSGVDAFNAINLQITNNYGISYFNITEISRQAENNLT